MLVIGLTGGIGAGKSTVARAFARRGATVIDVDGLGREVLEPAGAAYRGVVEAFGSGVLAADGSIDRAALAAEVFAGEAGRLAELEAISHPAINDALVGRLATEDAPVVVLDMAVLVESRLGRIGGDRVYHRVVVVEAPADVRLARLAARGMSAEDARARLDAQASDAERRALADLVIVNDGDLAQLDAAITTFWPTIEAWQLQSPPGGARPRAER